MAVAATLRQEIESGLAHRIPSALTPAPPLFRPLVATGIAALDEALTGGFPSGAITEIVGPECSGRTTLALSFLAQITAEGKVCAWIDASNALHPESAAAAGIQLERLLWVRCGAEKSKQQSAQQNCFSLPEKYLAAAPIKRGLHGGGFGPHPRGEVKGLSDAVGGLLRPEAIAPRCAEPQRKERPSRETFEPAPFQCLPGQRKTTASRPLHRIDQALRTVDLLLQSGGFSAIVLDFGSIAPEFVSRVPLATWFRYRASAERTQASILLLTQHACAKSSAGLVLRMHPGEPQQEQPTVFTGIKSRIAIARERFAPPAKVIPLRKPPQSERQAAWHSRCAWAGRP